jgi:mono/diheme cytochrome c family protein
VGRPMRPDRRAALAVALVLAGARVAGAFPWSIDMFRGQSVQPLARPPRVMPSGTLPVSGGEPPLSRAEADGTLKNPLATTPAHLQHGKELFETDCAPCHGSGAMGDGPIAGHTAAPATNLIAGQPTERSDGYLYATIRNGSTVMPAYGDAMSPAERWEVVLYLRQLQREAKR